MVKFLSLNKEIVEKIQKTIEESKKTNDNKVLSFFIWNKSFEYIYLFYINEKSKFTNEEFLWTEIVKLPNKLTLFTQNDKNLLDLLNTSLLSRYKFDKYKTEKKEDEINIIVNEKNKKIIKDRISTIKNIILSRDLSETPSKDLTPEHFVKIVKKTKFKNTKITVLKYKDIQKKWLNLIDAVWKWSINKPYMVILERIVDKNAQTYWIVWKWITFDTGWIQVKPWDYMYEMKWDMSWAATTYCVMKELDKKDLKVNLISCLCLAENHISGESYKPSDIIKSYSWKTVDIIHTDAEWRLILADGISYISKNYKLDNIISIATLTWAAMVALWFRYAAIMWNNDKLINKFEEYSKENFEKYIRLPFDNYFIRKTESEYADLQNLTKWINAWSSMWWAFLSNFVMNKEQFTHIDIAWPAINSYEPYWLYNKWMTWFWVDSISNIFLDLK